MGLTLDRNVTSECTRKKEQRKKEKKNNFFALYNFDLKTVTSVTLIYASISDSNTD